MTTPIISNQDADTYWATRLHNTDWLELDEVTKTAALLDATERLNSLAYIGFKHPGYLVIQVNPGHFVLQDVVDAEATQEFAFPRGADTAIPQVILDACCEIAKVISDPAYDADLEHANLGSTAQGYSSVRNTYDLMRSREHIMAGIPSITAWNKIKPYLRDAKSIAISRVS